MKIRPFFCAMILFFVHYAETLPTSFKAIVLAAGSSTRFKTPGKSKLLAPICGQPMIGYPIKLFETLNIPTVVVIGYLRDQVRNALEAIAHKPLTFVVQEEQLGTGHALLCTQDHWDADHIILINGDMPLVTPETIQELIDKHQSTNAALTLSVAHCVDPSIAYGRIVTENGITKIVEKKHFTYAIEDFPMVNCGIYIINRAFLENHLKAVEQNELTHEFYVTDLVELASKNNLPVSLVETSFQVTHGVNTFQQLAHVEHLKRKELLNHFMTNGVRFILPETTRIDLEVQIGAGTVIGAGAELLGSTHIGTNCTIGSHCILKNASIKDDSVIKPFTTVSK